MTRAGLELLFWLLALAIGGWMLHALLTATHEGDRVQYGLDIEECQAVCGADGVQSWTRDGTQNHAEHVVHGDGSVTVAVTAQAVGMRCECAESEGHDDD